MPVPASKILQFNEFTLDPSRASLTGPQGPLPLRPKAFDVLSISLATQTGSSPRTN